MSRSPTSPEASVRRLIDEGYDVSLVDGLLLVRGVPCVDEERTVRSGTLAVSVARAGRDLLPPRQHPAWWAGPLPCDAQGTPLHRLVEGRDRRLLEPGVTSDHRFCNRPRGREFHDYHEYVTTYVALLGVHAAEIDAKATARRGEGGGSARRSVFAYADTATSRAGIGEAAERIADQAVGIVGLGGTGSYVLDLVAKCPVTSIHLFDADRFEQHNAFRCPGAFDTEVVRREPAKVHLLAEVYSRLHRRIVPHAIRIDGGTAAMLDLLDFVFVCVDDGRARRTILSRLADRNIPCVDVGMGLSATEGGIVGAVRTTLVTSATHDAALARVPAGDVPDDPYATNIQVADLNALNAALAVIAWKRSRGFYAPVRRADHGVFVAETGALHREDL